MDQTEQAMRLALANPRLALEHLDKLDAETKLIDFISLMWSVLEPGRKFIRGWAVEAICEHLEAVTSGQIRRLLINVPPGTMKSLTTNVFWPAWEWGPKNRPSTRYVGASYAEALTIRDNRKTRALIVDDLYQRHWGHVCRLSSEQAAKTRFDTTATGFKLATSVGGLGTGERGDRFIIDDPHNVREAESELRREVVLQWLTEVVPTRLNDADESAIIMIMQRVHENDASGHLLEHNLGWDHLCLPMEYEPDHPHKSKTSIQFTDPRKKPGELLWPERFSREYLEGELKPTFESWGGEYAVAGQLQQRPAPRGGGLFKRKDFVYIGADQMPTKTRKVRGWDLAATENRQAPYTAGVLLAEDADGKVYIEDVVRIRGTPGQVEALIVKTAEKDGYGVDIDLPQDPGQAGKSQKAYLVGKLAGYKAYASPESGSKVERATPLAAQCEAGNLYVVRGSWNKALVDEASTFPKGRFKDQIDAMSRAYARITMHRKRKVPVAPILLEDGR